MVELHVARGGNEAAPGTRDQPFGTIARAQAAAREHGRRGKEPLTVLLHGGTWPLDHPIRLGPEDSGAPGAPVIYAAAPGEVVTLSGGRRLECRWAPHAGGVMVCRLEGQGAPGFTQLFVNGRRQVRARYPDFQPGDPRKYPGTILAAGRLHDAERDPHPGPDDDMTFSGGAPRGVFFDPRTFTRKRWANPAEAVIHIYQSEYWGNMQWRVKDIYWDRHIIWFGNGGHQVGAKWCDAPCEVNHESRLFVENVFEELDAPGEWYLDGAGGLLYYYPPTDLDLSKAVVEVPLSQQVVRPIGTQDDPVHDITLRGFRVAHTASTFLEPYEVPSLSDWAIHRGGAIFLSGARACRIESFLFDAVGGNGVFMSHYNRRDVVLGCTFTEAGDSAVCFVGSPESTVGTQRSFPFECRAENNLVHDCGVFGKQSAGVYISRARRITAAHNEIRDMPRAGICIGDGTWGGHLIEYNDIHGTCRETGDHGPFNAWGRDRYWCLSQPRMPYTTGRSHDAGDVKTDAMEPVIVRHNVFEEESGWGLDLDDGASCYEISNNLCVGVSVKLREGAWRTISNNIWVNGANSPCFHVGNENNHDRFVRNITVMRASRMKPEEDLSFSMGRGYGEIYTLIAPPARGPWLEEIDYNCFWSDLGQFVAQAARPAMVKRTYSLDEWRALGFDRHSVFADPLFVDPGNGDYRLRPELPALALGFGSFDTRAAGLLPDFQAFAPTVDNHGEAKSR